VPLVLFAVAELLVLGAGEPLYGPGEVLRGAPDPTASKPPAWCTRVGIDRVSGTQEEADVVVCDREAGLFSSSERLAISFRSESG